MTPAPASARMKIHESTGANGTLSSVVLVLEEGTLSISDGPTEVFLPLPEGALAVVMAKFGAPLEPAEESRLIPVATLDLGDGTTLRHVRHLAQWDVIARDYLVYDDGGPEKSCVLATTVAGALQHLGRAGAERR